MTTLHWLTGGTVTLVILLEQEFHFLVYWSVWPTAFYLFVFSDFSSILDKVDNLLFIELLGYHSVLIFDLFESTFLIPYLFPNSFIVKCPKVHSVFGPFLFPIDIHSLEDLISSMALYTIYVPLTAQSTSASHVSLLNITLICPAA